MSQSIEIGDNFIEPRIRILRFAQASSNTFDNFTRQPDNALVLGLDARASFQCEPHDIGDQAKSEYERYQEIDPRAQRKILPHDHAFTRISPACRDYELDSEIRRRSYRIEATFDCQSCHSKGARLMQRSNRGVGRDLLTEFLADRVYGVNPCAF
jgi:hypothetical protein